MVSGGQTGVDRAALDAAILCGIDIAGWCPRNRRAEDGAIPPRYPLHETPSGAYAERTRWNVRDADATLILTRGPPTRGTALTRSLARIQGQPVLMLDSQAHPAEAAAEAIREWIETAGIQILNVAGPRESSSPGIYDWALRVLALAFAE